MEVHMLEGLWTVEFRTNLGSFGYGVGVFVSNRILGGDSSYYYDGAVKIEGESVTGELKVINYSGQMPSVFGNLTNFSIKFSGTLPRGPEFAFSGYLKENPNMKITIKGRKRSDL